MTERGVIESVIEQATLPWLESVGGSVRHGVEIAPGELAAECSDYEQVVLEQRLRDVSAWLNPAFSPLHWTIPCASSPA